MNGFSYYGTQTTDNLNNIDADNINLSTTQSQVIASDLKGDFYGITDAAGILSSDGNGNFEFGGIPAVDIDFDFTYGNRMLNSSADKTSIEESTITISSTNLTVPLRLSLPNIIPVTIGNTYPIIYGFSNTGYQSLITDPDFYYDGNQTITVGLIKLTDLTPLAAGQRQYLFIDGSGYIKQNTNVYASSSGQLTAISFQGTGFSTTHKYLLLNDSSGNIIQSTGAYDSSGGGDIVTKTLICTDFDNTAENILYNNGSKKIVQDTGATTDGDGNWTLNSLGVINDITSDNLYVTNDITSATLRTSGETSADSFSSDNSITLGSFSTTKKYLTYGNNTTGHLRELIQDTAIYTDGSGKLTATDLVAINDVSCEGVITKSGPATIVGWIFSYFMTVDGGLTNRANGPNYITNTTAYYMKMPSTYTNTTINIYNPLGSTKFLINGTNNDLLAIYNAGMYKFFYSISTNNNGGGNGVNYATFVEFYYGGGSSTLADSSDSVNNDSHNYCSTTVLSFICNIPYACNVGFGIACDNNPGGARGLVINNLSIIVERIT